MWQALPLVAEWQLMAMNGMTVAIGDWAYWGNGVYSLFGFRGLVAIRKDSAK